MDFFTHYLQPLSIWLYDNPHWALLVTFLISFSESLAIVGSIIPGSVTMTAIGILAGSGVMRIDLTLLAAALGAIAGDTASYALGYKFHHRLVYIWPFSRYPHWLKYGKEYFRKHGGKSVLIGRFIGPLRSIIPVIAGMMHMNHWQFLVANVVSAIGWSILYVMPGILIGAAGSELSTERASMLFMVVILFLVAVWGLSIAVKWLLKHLHFFFRTTLHSFWYNACANSQLSRWFKTITPQHETEYHLTAGLVILFLCSFLTIILLSFLVIQNIWIQSVNVPVNLFLQSIRSPSFDYFFVFIELIIHPLSLGILTLSISIYFIYQKDWRTLLFWLSLVVSSIIIVSFTAWVIKIPSIDSHHALSLKPAYYPDIYLTLATSLLGFLIFYISARYLTVLTLGIRIVFVMVLFLAGISILYLGDNWLTSVVIAYFTGLCICIGHWIWFRRIDLEQKQSHIPIAFSCLMLVIGTIISYVIYFELNITVHQPVFKQYVLTEKTWWSQHPPILPLYTKNRIGQRKGLFNFQYIGSLETLEQDLTLSGWKRYDDSFLSSLLMRTGAKNTHTGFPLMTHLYHNRKPKLIMTYQPDKQHPFPLLVFRLWRSNYHVDRHEQPIWLGSVYLANDNKKIEPLNQQSPLHIICHTLSHYKTKKIRINDALIQALPYSVLPYILLIKSPQTD